MKIRNDFLLRFSFLTKPFFHLFPCISPRMGSLIWSSWACSMERLGQSSWESVERWQLGAIHLTLRSLPTLPNHFTMFVLLVASTHPKNEFGHTNVTYTHHIHIMYTSCNLVHIMYIHMHYVTKLWPRSTFPPVRTSRLGSRQFLFFS